MFHRKLKQVPLGIDHPVWVNDDDFDIDRHVHRMALPSPGGDASSPTCAATWLASRLGRRSIRRTSASRRRL